MNYQNVKRWAITIPTDDPAYRMLAFPNQGRKHYDTKEQAEEALKNLQSNNSSERLREFKLDQARVDEVECYHHGDAISVWVKVSDEPV